ncbi:MAG: hypothetical protein KU38_01985 [Sulfurovum sp. FS08-3]|nr:MAG: hypothetical protein KU38_01985 [Sulfurovum sp. FS08-3]
MQEFMATYKEHIDDIEHFLEGTIFNLGEIHDRQGNQFEKLFSVFPSLELIYVCDETTLLQTSDNIYRSKSSSAPRGRDRSYLMEKLDFNESNLAITKPYISSATGETCITVAKQEAGSIYFMDFNLVALLQRLGLMEIHKEFNVMTKGFYIITGIIMMGLALFTLGYSVWEFFHSVFVKVDMSIESIFKPVIALTLGLAIFDLAKTSLEQEVVFKSYSKSGKSEYKVLIKFSITIIIALLIEALMVVFKIAIHSYEAMIHALYLIGGVSILMIALGLFIYLSSKGKE